MRRWRVALGSGAVMAAVLGTLWAADVLHELGVDDAQARQTVVDALSSGAVSVWPARTALKAASPAQRAALVEGAIAWARAYTETPEFAAAYAAARAASMPEAPAERPSVDEEIAQQYAEQQRQIEAMQRNLAALPADQRAVVEEGVRAAATSMEQMRNDPQMQQIQRQALEAQRAAARQEYEKATADWQERYPQDPRPVIARRLRDFLAVSGRVDFAAELVGEGTPRRFANPAYERETAAWKLCYRAGRESVAAARSAATAWLAQLEGKKD